MARIAALAHPILLAVYPLLVIYADHFEYVAPRDTLRPLLVGLCAGAVLVAIAFAALRDAAKAGLAASLVIALLWLYRPVMWGSEQLLPAAVAPISAYLFVLLVGTAVGLYLVVTARDARIAATVAACLVLCMASIPLFVLATASARGNTAESLPEGVVTARTDVARKPDIYYIILDGYGRDDVLAELHGFDNSPFLEALEQRGFYVARRSQSNYSQTMLSIASSLNMMHYDETTPNAASPQAAAALLRDLVATNRVAELVKAQRYRFVTLRSELSSLDNLAIADVVVDGDGAALIEFELLAIDLTPIPSFLKLVGLNRLVGDQVLSSLSPLEAHRRNVMTAFDALERLPDQREPAFVFAHVLAPHPPFVFDRNGNLPPQRGGGFTFFDAQRDLGSAAYSRTYYAEQVRYLNGRVLAAVDAILARAPIHDRPIIVIQGDHGPSTCFAEADAQFKYRERMSILNAYYIPPGVTCELYDTITPVNTFRVIFDGVFGTRLGRLSDVSRYSRYESPFDFVEIDPTGRPVAGAPPDTTVLDQ